MCTDEVAINLAMSDSFSAIAINLMQLMNSPGALVEANVLTREVIVCVHRLALCCQNGTVAAPAVAAPDNSQQPLKSASSAATVTVPVFNSGNLPSAIVSASMSPTLPNRTFTACAQAENGAFEIKKFSCPVCFEVLNSFKVFKTHVKHLQILCAKAQSEREQFDYKQWARRKCRLSMLIDRHHELLNLPPQVTVVEFQKAATSYVDQLHNCINNRAAYRQVFDEPNTVWHYRMETRNTAPAAANGGIVEQQ